MTDKELSGKLAALKMGERSAFEEIYNEISTSAYTVAYRITGDRCLSEDIIQEFFIRLYRKPPETTLEKPRAYLLRMVHNLTIDKLEKQHVSIDECENILSDKADSADERIDLEIAFRKLTSEERQLVTLHLNGGFRFREIAEIMNIPVGTALWRYRKAINKLRNILNGGEK